MKKIFLIASLFVLTKAFGQTPTTNSTELVSTHSNLVQNDTSVIVSIIVGMGVQGPKTTYFLNDQFINQSLLVSINPELMDKLNVIYKEIQIDSIKYNKQIRLVTKKPYTPKPISLTNLKNKYYPGGLKNKQTIFIIDGNIAHGDNDTYEIDQNNLYAITLDREYTKDNISIQFIKLTTKSDANISNFKLGNTWMQANGITLLK